MRSVLLAGLAVTVLLAASCSKGSSQAPPGGTKRGGAMKFPVEVAPVESRRVEYAVSGVGTVEAFESVQVTARVGGAVDRVMFSEGEVVKEGQTLVEVETRRYEIAAQSARAAVARAQSMVADARAGVERREKAVAQSPGLIPGEEIEGFRTKAKTAEADVASARAALQLAELNLRDAYVRAPVAGVIETRTVQTGQYLQPGAVLATLVRRDPMLLRFQVAVADAEKMTDGMQVHFRVRSEEKEHVATISHVSGAASGTSRMVTVTANIDPAGAAELKPGAFAEIRVPIAAATEAPVIPQIAVRPSENGFLAFVVEGEVARQRVLQLGMRTADGRVEVRDGLKPGEQLVIRGAEALRDGAAVRVAGKEAPPDGGGKKAAAAAAERRP